MKEIPSHQDLDNLFDPLYEEYYALSTSKVSNNFASNTLDVENTSLQSSIIVEDSDAPQIVTSSEESITQESSTLFLETHSDEQIQEDVAKLDKNTIMHSFKNTELDEAESSLNYYRIPTTIQEDISKVPDTKDTIRFKLDAQEIIYTVDMFRDTLKLLVETPDKNPLVAPINIEIIESFMQRTTNLRNEISNFQQRFDESFHEAWDRYKDLLRACPPHGFTELHQLDTFYNALNQSDQDSLNSAAGGNLLERPTQDVLTIIEKKSKSAIPETNRLFPSVVTTAMTAILKQFQATLPSASVKSVEEICVTCGGAHPYYQCLAAGGNTFPEFWDNIQGYVAAAAFNYNQGNSGYRPPGSRYLPSNTIANPKGELKAITTRSGIVLDGPSVPIPPPFFNPEEDEHVKETLTNQDLAEYTIKVPPLLVQKSKPPSQSDFVVHQRDPLHPNIPYPSRMLKQKQQEKDKLKALLSNKDKLLELANTPLNENCSAVILKKLLEKLGDPGKFLIPCSFNELKCKALVDLSASINLMPLSVWKKLGLPELISTRMTLELANRAICTPAGITRDVFVPVGKFTFPADFVIVDYKSNPRVPLILGRPFLWIARALINVHGEEMILHDGDDRLTLNMRHDTSSYSNQPQKESINMINVFNDSSEVFLKNLFSTNQPSGNPTFSSHPELTSLEVKDDIFNPEGGNVLPEKLLDLDSTKDLHPPHHVNPLSGRTTSSSSPNQLLEEFADELALITFPPGMMIFSLISSPISKR
uniref:Reverse transcriptase domain-containing protein n=1 Tax=Tanacetum cinerariifolium TaxID=118510 RepID=A0A6L2N6I8_TANCI|nr:reverse transcriptase domain-containing protein [Tanacetum cinerariifolium]